MSIIVNGTTIPTTLGSIKVGSTNITKVNVVSGSTTTTVWSTSNAYYAYQNSTANTSDGITNPTITSTNSTGNGSGTANITTYNNGIGLVVNSIWTNSSSSGYVVKMRTPKLPVNGNTSCAIDISYGYTSGGGILTAYYKVYGVSSSGTETLLKSGLTGDGGSGSFTLTVSSYSSIIIEGEVNAGTSNNRDRTCLVTIKNCYFS